MGNKEEDRQKDVSRAADLLPADLQPRIREFTPAQLIALRFASDREGVGLWL